MVERNREVRQQLSLRERPIAPLDSRRRKSLQSDYLAPHRRGYLLRVGRWCNGAKRGVQIRTEGSFRGVAGAAP